MATKIVTKNSSTASAVPTASDLVQGELAVNVADKRLFTEDNAGAIVELGTNPSTIDINAGTIDGTAIGASSASTGAFTTLTATGAFTSRGIDDNADATAITIDSSENVGIGTSSPSYPFHVTGSGDTVAAVTAGASSIAALNLGNSTNLADGGIRYDNGADALILRASNAERMRIDSSGNVGIGVIPETWQSTIDALQVGLGASFAGNTTNPSRVYLSANYYINSSNQESYLATDEASQYFQNAGTHIFKVAPSGTADSAISWTTAMTVDNSGNVGIGTSSPSSFNYLSTSPHLVIGGGSSDAGVTCYSSTNGYGRLAFADGTNTTEQYRGLIQFYHGDNSMQFYTGSDERMRIDSSGNVGIGVSNPSDYYTNFNDLVLGSTSTHSGMTIASGTTHDGTIAFADGTSGTAEYQGYVQYNHEVNTLTFGTAATTRMTIDSSGNLLVGKTSTDDGVNGFKVAPTGVVTSTVSSPSTNTYLVYSGGYKFYVNTDGGISNFSANNVNLSDEREKKNIELLESQWDSLKQWSLKKFHYNADADSDNKKLGVIAQEVETHNPEVIDEFNVNDETTRMAVKEQQMMWMAIKALQEAQTRIETLEARVTELENN